MTISANLIDGRSRTSGFRNSEKRYALLPGSSLQNVSIESRALTHALDSAGGVADRKSELRTVLLILLLHER